MKGILYIVATPIGNLEDVTLRAVKVLQEVDIIAAEDTRKLQILLKRYGISPPSMISFFQGNEEKRTREIIGILLEGKKVALVSESGTPTISDPGYKLVKEAVELGLRVVPVPGPSALIAALSASGLPTDSFCFFGFLPPKGSKRRKRLEQLATCRPTVVLYESPRRLETTLEDLLKWCGNRRIVLAREITKLHEEFLRGTIKEVIEEIKRFPRRGEITLIMEGLGWR